MLVGNAAPEEFAQGAPEMESMDGGSTKLAGAVFLQALFEVRAGAMCEMLPPALHPTLPPVAGISLIDVADSEWGPFRLAQLRIECRSGLRPRALLVSAVINNGGARDAFRDRYGFRLRDGDVSLERGYHETSFGVEVDGQTWLRGAMRGPVRIGEGDTQFVSSMHPAQTPSGFRLVQVDTRYAVQRAERAPLDLEKFDATAWGEARLEPSLMLPAVVGIADITFDALRFVCRPDVLAFEGTEAVGGAA